VETAEGVDGYGFGVEGVGYLVRGDVDELDGEGAHDEEGGEGWEGENGFYFVLRRWVNIARDLF
jgi:hypothetical protein